MRRRRHSRPAAAVLAIALVLGLAPPVLAADTTAPVGTLTVNGGTTVTNDPEHVRLDTPATDDDSGVAVVLLYVNGAGPMVLDYAPSYELALPWWNDGPNTITVRWQDVAGNESEPASAALTVDLLAPDGTIRVDDYGATGVTFTLAASDPSDVAGVAFACERQATPTVRPYATRITVPFGAGGLDCGAAFGPVALHVGFRDAAGNVSWRTLEAIREPTLTIRTPLAAVTGQPFTFEPVVPDGYLLPPDGGCRWELRWGDDAALTAQFNETYGGMVFDVAAKNGRCPSWTFTLPWVPVPQFDLNLALTTYSGNEVGSFAYAHKRFMATVGSSERRITSSNLPIAQVLPSTYTPIVGQPITYTRYLIGGAVGGSSPHWTAHLGSGEDPIVWERVTTASTFTITPPRTGPLLVQWYREIDGKLLSAGYDPPVRVRDTTAPNSATPTVRKASVARTLHGVKVTWSGTDKGWGIASYRLERSFRGGAWTRVTLPSARTTSIVQKLTATGTYRYRVRATDKAGNVGSWDYSTVYHLRRTRLTRG